MYLYARSQYPQRLTKGRQWLLISHLLSLSQPAACTSTLPVSVVSQNSYYTFNTWCTKCLNRAVALNFFPAFTRSFAFRIASLTIAGPFMCFALSESMTLSWKAETSLKMMRFVWIWKNMNKFTDLTNGCRTTENEFESSESWLKRILIENFSRHTDSQFTAVAEMSCLGPCTSP